MYTLFILMLLTAPIAQPVDAKPQLRTITHEDVWLARRLGAPILSPDGSRVLVGVVDPAYDPEQVVTDLWLLDTNGRTPARRITFFSTGTSLLPQRRYGPNGSSTTTGSISSVNRKPK